MVLSVVADKVFNVKTAPMVVIAVWDQEAQS